MVDDEPAPRRGSHWTWTRCVSRSVAFVKDSVKIELVQRPSQCFGGSGVNNCSLGHPVSKGGEHGRLDETGEGNFMGFFSFFGYRNPRNMVPNITSAPTGVLFEGEDLDELKNEKVTKEDIITPYKRSIVWRNVFVFSGLHIGALYGLYLVFTSAKLATTIFGTSGFGWLVFFFGFFFFQGFAFHAFFLQQYFYTSALDLESQPVLTDYGLTSRTKRNGRYE